MGIIYSITNMPGPSKKQERKDKVWENTQTCCAKYSKCMFVNVDNVTSKQICIMRKQFREIDAVMCMGKNTLMRKAIKEMQDADIEENKSRPHLNIITDALVLNTGCIFTNGDLSVISKILDTQVRSAPAKVGSMAPIDVTVPAGPTGMDPKQTGFFQALNIQTKIVKSQVEIVNAVKVISSGEKITPGQAALLEKLKVRPFEYKMNILNILDNGEIYPASFSRSPTTLSLLASRRLVITSPPSPSLSACPTLLPSTPSFLTPSRTSHALPSLQALDSRKLISSPQLLPAPPLKPHLPLLPLPPPRPPRR